jgi:membrane protein
MSYRSRHETGDLPPVKMFFFSLIRFILRVADNFYHDSCLIRASGLAFNSLLALVPLSAVIFAFGGLSNVGGVLQEFLVEVLLPSSLNQILDALNAFRENSTKLGTYGLIFFLITVLFLMNNIENNLNAIWHCRRKRRFFQQFTIYTTVIVFASLLIGGNFSLSGDLLAILPDYSDALKEPFFVKTLYRISSILFITLTFLLIILLIPSTRVSFRSALTGALTGALIWELAKWGFKTWANYSVRNSVIYGSLFLIPLLLIWLYAVWLIIMIAMETAYVLQHRKERKNLAGEDMERTYSFKTKLSLYRFVAEKYNSGNGATTIKELSGQLCLSEEDIEKTSSILVKEGLLIAAGEEQFIPAESPEKVLLSRLFRELIGWDHIKETTLEAYCRGGEKELNNMTVSDLIEDNDSTES